MSKTASLTLKIVWILSIVLSIVTRIPGLYGSSMFWRVHQTELTAYWFRKEGIDLLNYQTPIYGPPFQIPFEFPLFQATAALLSEIGHRGIVFASRLTALLSFYLTALILYALCKKIFKDHATPFVIITLFLWLPYNIYYSTESLIDYLALALALAYLLFTLLWLKSRKQFFFVLLAVISGSLAIMVKPTTTPMVIVPIIVFVLKDILAVGKETLSKPSNTGQVVRNFLAQWKYWLAIFVMAFIPLLSGSLWTRHADDLKSTSIFTQGYTSEALHTWNFGSWALRSNQWIWIDHAQTGLRWLLPYGLELFAILGIFAALRIVKNEDSEEVHLFILSISASLLTTFAIFLNLYLHQYYFIAWTATLSILAGYGIVMFWRLRSSMLPAAKYFFIVWAIIFMAGNFKDYQSFRVLVQTDTQKWYKRSNWAERVQNFIPEDKWVIVVDYDWSPTYPYLLERKAMVYSPKVDGLPICLMADKPEFTLVVLADKNYKDYLDRVLDCFKSSTEVLPGIYQVQH